MSSKPHQKAEQLDPVWQDIQADAQARVKEDAAMAGFLHDAILGQPSLEKALAVHLGNKLGNDEIGAAQVSEDLMCGFDGNGDFAPSVRADLVAVRERDPACYSYLDALLFFKGFLALQAHRSAHCCWQQGRKTCALYLQNRVSEVFGVDIHPAAQFGKSIMIDHATGVVVGETAVVGDDVSLLHGVTLGGTGRERGDRHPKIGNGVLISVGAKVLGNIRIGECAKIGAGSVVLSDIPAYSTAVGVPARVVGKTEGDEPSRTMDQQFTTEKEAK